MLDAQLSRAHSPAPVEGSETMLEIQITITPTKPRQNTIKPEELLTPPRNQGLVGVIRTVL
jgi:hypothetical protein